MLGLFNLPGAAGNWQEIMTRWWSPSISVNFAGNPDVERAVNEDVASYGTQIGWLNDVVLALAAGLPPDANENVKAALANMKEADEKISDIIRWRKGNAMTKAREALKELQKSDADGYHRLLQSLERDEPRTSAGS